ncbi:MAG: VWA domain-containing protein [bacterium]|nr:VWA domain-containing protein [bacterium]MDY2829865.1 VWA domain-containing protein [Alphaproteobacteria bacterium]
MAVDSLDEEMIPYVEFADNANERTPCVLVLDCSGSMRGEPIKQLNTGLKALEQELKDDIDASSRVQLLIIKAFGKDEAVVSSDWIDAMNFEAPEMEAGGLTPLGKAMELALKKIEEQKALYDSCGITSKRPWIFLISDGEPTDYDWEIVAKKCREAQKNKKVVIHAVGTQGANLDKLAQFSTNSPKRLSGLRFTEFFLWLSRSVSCVSRAAPNATDLLEDTDAWDEK